MLFDAYPEVLDSKYRDIFDERLQKKAVISYLLGNLDDSNLLDTVNEIIKINMDKSLSIFIIKQIEVMFQRLNDHQLLYRFTQSFPPDSFYGSFDNIINENVCRAKDSARMEINRTFRSFYNEFIQDDADEFRKIAANEQTLREFERENVLDKAAAFGSVNIFKFFLLNGLKVTPDTCEEACAGGSLEILRICAQNCRSFQNSPEIALRKMRYNMADWIVDNTECKFPPASVMIKRYALSMIYKFIEHNVRDISFICYALRRRNPGFAKMYELVMPKLNFSMIRFVDVKCIDNCRYLIENGMYVNTVSSDNMTLLYQSCVIGNEEMFDYLISKGAKVLEYQKVGHYAAALSSNRKIASKLKEMGKAKKDMYSIAIEGSLEEFKENFQNHSNMAFIVKFGQPCIVDFILNVYCGLGPMFMIAAAGRTDLLQLSRVRAMINRDPITAYKYALASEKYEFAKLVNPDPTKPKALPALIKGVRSNFKSWVEKPNDDFVMNDQDVIVCGNDNDIEKFISLLGVVNNQVKIEGVVRRVIVLNKNKNNTVKGAVYVTSSETKKWNIARIKSDYNVCLVVMFPDEKRTCVDEICAECRDAYVRFLEVTSFVDTDVLKVVLQDSFPKKSKILYI